MIHWKTVKEFFGFGDKSANLVTNEAIEVSPTRPISPPPMKQQSQITLKNAQERKLRTNPKHYYRRGLKYYSVDDDSLIEDIILLYVLTDLFSDNDIQTFEEMEQAAFESSQEDLLDVDVSETEVVESQTSSDTKVEVPADNTPAPVSYEPEPVKQESYSSGYSDSSSYDSGSSGSDGSDD